MDSNDFIPEQLYLIKLTQRAKVRREVPSSIGWKGWLILKFKEIPTNKLVASLIFNFWYAQIAKVCILGLNPEDIAECRAMTAEEVVEYNRENETKLRTHYESLIKDCKSFHTLP